MATQRRQSNQKRPVAGRPAARGAAASPGVAGSVGANESDIGDETVRSPSSAPRRLGNQQATRQRPQSASAARRYDRSHRKNSKRWGWLSVALVVVVVAVLVIVKVGGGSGSGSNSSAASSGQHPAAAPASLVNMVTTVPASVFDSVKTAGAASSFVVAKGQPPLTSGSKPQFLYVGGEFCPWCAVTRYSLIAALSRFGTFHDLKITTSGPNDGNIPTFSFLGSTYTSKYVSFTPYETQDRNGNPLEQPPASVNALYAKYDGSSTGAPAPTFNTSSGAGIPFLDIGNTYLSAGAPLSFSATEQALAGGGDPGRVPIAQALRQPNSAVGKAINASAFIGEANFMSAAICAADGGKPASVCDSPGVHAAAKVLAAVKPVG